jgi:hypothetical protein
VLEQINRATNRDTVVGIVDIPPLPIADADAEMAQPALVEEGPVVLDEVIEEPVTSGGSGVIENEGRVGPD